LFIDKDEYAHAIMMVVAFVLYVANNIVLNIKQNATVFNEYLEDLGLFMAFGVTTMFFGLFFYKDSVAVMMVVFFYAIAMVLGLARNWVLKYKNSVGWPVPLNGIFFPLLYFFYQIYLQSPGNSIFIFYFIIIGILSLSRYNFLGDHSKILDSSIGDSNYEIRGEDGGNLVIRKPDAEIEKDKISKIKFTEKFAEAVVKINEKHIPQLEDKRGIFKKLFKKRL